MNDQSLMQIMNKQGELFKEMREQLERILFSEKAQNPKFSNFKEQNTLPHNQQQLLKQLQAYNLGQLSQIKENSAQLANFQNRGLKNVFQLYDQFERYEHIPIIATKIIQAVRNGVYQLEQQDLIANKKTVEDLIQRIPPKLKKFQNFTKTPQFLSDILDFLQTFKKNSQKKSILQRELDKVLLNPHAKFEDMNSIAQIYQEISKKLSQEGLNNQEQKLLEVLNQQMKQILSNPNSEAIFSLSNQNTPEYLRLIANNPRSLVQQRQEALELLNMFAKNETVCLKMLSSNFFIDKSSELIHRIMNQNPNLEKTDQKNQNVLKEDLEFMKQLTYLKEGVRLALESVTLQKPLIDTLLKILLSNIKNEDLKIEALLVLLNLLPFDESDRIQTKLLKEINNLLQNNRNLKKLYTELVQLANVLIYHDPCNKKKLIQKDILNKVREGLSNYETNAPQLVMNTAKLIFNLIEENPESHDYVISSNILKLFPKHFKDTQLPNILHKDLCKSINHLGYQNDKRKQVICDIGFCKGLVELLIHYSSKNDYDKEMIDLVLKCMVNFSRIHQGKSDLLFDSVIPAFQDFFQTYKKKLEDSCKMMLHSLANLSYSTQDKLLDRLIKDKGIELILQALEHFNKKKQLQQTEAALDALIMVSSNKPALDYLNQTKTKAINTLVDILRQKLSKDLIYKTLCCLTKFSQNKSLNQQLISKGGHGVIADLFKEIKKDHKNVFQAIKLLTYLVKNRNEMLQDFIYSGVPGKIIKNFDLEWPVDIIKDAILLFSRMSLQEGVRQIISSEFLEDLLTIIDKNIDNRVIVKHGIKLLSLCSGNVQSVDIIQENGGNPIAHSILEQYKSNEKIQLDDCFLLENLIRMNKSSKPELLEVKTDYLIEDQMKEIDQDVQRQLYLQFKLVLSLLRSTKETIDSYQDLQQQDDISEDLTNELEKMKERDRDLTKVIPPNIQKFLQQGRILRLFGEDGVCRSMHFYLSKDMTDLKCKHPKENFVKQKWIMPIHQVKDIKQGYQKNSPIAKSGNFFRRAPTKEKCLVVYGPTLLDGPKNFYIVCDRPHLANKWFKYLNLILEEYKKSKAKNLKRDKEIVN